MPFLARQRRALSLPAFGLVLACQNGSSDDAASGDTTGDDEIGTSQTSESAGESSGSETDTTGESDHSMIECQDGEQQCLGSLHQICVDGAWQDDPCDPGSFCDEATNDCSACVCEPGSTGDCIDDNNLGACKPDCSGYEPQACDLGVCIEGACVDLICAPNESSCIDDESLHVCNSIGTEWGPAQPCIPGSTCVGDTCVSDCVIAEVSESNVGCEFWALDMANVPPRDKFTYAVAISNPSFDDVATIGIYDRNGGTEQQLIEDSIDPRDVKVFNLSGSHANYTSHYNGVDAGFLGNGIAKGRAFRVASDIPVIATQFNPIGGASGYTTDASLLLPTHALGEDYIHLDWDLGFGTGAALDVIATQEDTTITITPTVSTAAGINGLPALTAGVPTQIALDRYDYLQLGANDLNLTGSTISSDKPVALFGGHACAAVPDESVLYCDHLEEQIFPLETWGTEYVASRNPIRGAEPMRWRVLAAEDGTDISFEPAVTIGAQAQLDAGEWLEFDDLIDFQVEANKPILVAGYMFGCGSVMPNQNCPGDPSMVLMIPVEQYQQDYVFLVDSSYDEDFAKLIRPNGVPVTVDCLGVVPENRWTVIGNSGYEWATIDLNPGEAFCQPGTNQASSNEGFGVIVVGQSARASYAYPGGLSLLSINPQ
ncbi:IgGFc-binding protein [Nannocystaceae bacterium ST9]